MELNSSVISFWALNESEAYKQNKLPKIAPHKLEDYVPWNIQKEKIHIQDCKGDTEYRYSKANIAKCKTRKTHVIHKASHYLLQACAAGQALDNSSNCAACDTSCPTCSVPANSSYCTSCVSSMRLNGTSVGNCVFPCPDNTYDDGTYCQPCDPSCAKCNAPNDGTTCTACTTSGYVVNGTSQGQCISACPSQTAVDLTYNLFCTPCEASCFNCSQPNDNTKCLSCPNPATQFVNGSSVGNCVAACPTNKALGADGIHCLPCDASCSQCNQDSSNLNCTGCATSGYVINGTSFGNCIATCDSQTALDATNTFCQPCDSTCFNCSVPGNSSFCTSCPAAPPGQVINGTTSGPCLSSCPSNTIKSADNMHCLPCDPSCAQCNQDSSNVNCTACSSSGYVINGSSYGNCVAACDPHTALDATNTFCQPCDSSCFNCSKPGNSSLCTNCPSSPTGQVINGTTSGPCLSSCPSNTIISADNLHCLPCDSSCSTCNQGSSNVNCTACTTSGYVINGSSYGNCVAACDPQTALETTFNTFCKPCDSTCFNCSIPGNSSMCTSCPTSPSGQVINGSTVGPCLSSCPSNTIISADTIHCLPCDASCATCNQANSNVNCTACMTSGYVINGSSYGNCIATCDPQTALETTTNTFCQPCDGTCFNCSIPNNSSMCTSCPSAPPGQVINGTTTGPCLSSCPSNTIISSDSVHCLPCHPSCAMCNQYNSDVNCTGCMTSGYVINGSSYGNCIASCGPQTALETTFNTFCQPCDNSCFNCSLPNNSSMCTSCPASPSGQVINGSTTGPCLSNCPSNTIISADTIHCLPCHSSCATCNQDNSNVNCTSCMTSGYVINGISYGNCVSACGPQTALETTYNTFCQPCDSTCFNCSLPNNSSMCTSCPTSTPSEVINGTTTGQCLSACPSNKIISADTIHCLPCDATCASCNQYSSSTNCTSCVSGYVNGTTYGNCVTSCGPQTALETTNNTFCLPCDSTCFNCTKPNNNTMCTSCQAAAPYLNGSTTGNCVVSCPSNTILNADNIHCLACDSSCATCNQVASSVNCTGCITSGYVINGTTYGNCVSACDPQTALETTNHTFCLPCDTTCFNCSLPNNNTMCTSCKAAAQYLNGTTTGNCVTACPTNSILYSDNVHCLPCDPSCATCNYNGSALNCTSCMTSGYVIDGSTYGNCVAACPAHTALETTTHTFCQPCDTTCQNCSLPNNATMCLNCFNSAQFVNGTTTGNCVASCPTNKILSVDTIHCLPCDSSCATCNQASSNFNCTSCSTSGYVVNGSSYGDCISSCISGTALETTTNTFCQPCDSSCLQCSIPNNSAYCLSCATSVPQKMVNGTTFGNCVSTCPTNSVLSGDTTHCLPCDTTCATCNTAASASNCTSCMTSGYVINGNSYGPCVAACPAQTALDTTLHTFCQPCSSSCYNCAAPGDATQCTSCPGSNKVYGVTTGTCIATCPTNSLIDGTATHCLPCDSSCAVCTVAGDPTKCTLCSTAGFVVNGVSVGNCVSTCPSHTALDTTLHNFCQPCGFSCSECSQPNNNNYCTSCATTGYLVFGANIGPCQAPPCPAQYAVDVATGTKCLPCDSSCNLCAQPQNNQQCTSCPTGYYLLGTSFGSCQSICPDGTALDVATHQHCLACSSSCLKCAAPADSTQCTLCPATYLVIGAVYGPCQIAPCPALTFENAAQTNCLPCHSSCVTCDGMLDSTKCTSCPTGKFVLGTVDGTCITGPCPAGTVEDPATHTKCETCYSSCVTCAVPADQSNCLTCQTGMVLLYASPGQCVTPCPAGSAQTCPTCTCLACDSSCATCSVPANVNRCTSCPSGYLYYYVSPNGKCLLACPNGYAPDPTNTNCLACGTNCATCVTPQDATKCTSCTPGNYFPVSSVQNTCNACTGNTAPDPTYHFCTTCDPACLTCYAPFDNQKCYTCVTGFAVGVYGPCSATCASNYYQTTTNCLPCNAACATCDLGTNSHCKSCYGSYVVTGPIIGTCSATCLANQALIPPANTHCDSCDSTCQTCALPNDFTQCTYCPAGRVLVFPPLGECLTSCPSHYAPDVATQRSCLSCDASCDQCSEPNNNQKCSACVTGLLVKGLVGPCISPPCPASYAENSAQTNCYLCDTSCATCFLPINSQQCGTCHTGFFLQIINPPNAGYCVSVCPPGWVQDSTAKYCFACDPSCATCIVPASNTECTSCPVGYSLVGGAVGFCVKGCPAGYALDPTGKKCYPCDPTCMSCLYPANSTSCVSCYLGTYLNVGNDGTSGLCLTSCPNGKAPSVESQECLPCDTSCDTCSIPSSNISCTSCNVGYTLFLSNMSCISSCPLGYAIAAGSNNCSICDSSCRTCTLPNSTSSCMQCGFTPTLQLLNKVLTSASYILGPYYAIPGTCVVNCTKGTFYDRSTNASCFSDKCPSQMYTDQLGMQCIPCDSSCGNCIIPYNSTACTSCTDLSKYLEIDTANFNYSLAEKNVSGNITYTMYGTCVASCNSTDVVNITAKICYKYPINLELPIIETKQHTGYMAANAMDSSMYYH